MNLSTDASDRERAAYLLGLGDGRASVTRTAHGRKLFILGMLAGVVLVRLAALLARS